MHISVYLTGLFLNLGYTSVGTLKDYARVSFLNHVEEPVHPGKTHTHKHTLSENQDLLIMNI